MSQWFVFVLVILAASFAVEFLTRSMPAPWRWVFLGALVVGILIWLFKILGVW